MPWVNIDDLPEERPASKREIDEMEEYLRQKKKPRFYADENFPQQAIEILRKWHASVVTAQQTGRRGHPDQNHLAEARRLRRILVTCDRDYLDEHRFPLIHCPAIVVFDFGSGTRDEIVQAFQCLVYVFSFPQFYDKWIKIDAKRDGWTQTIRFQDGSTVRERCRLHEGVPQVWRTS